MRIAITGASGFIGTHLRKRFPDHMVIKRWDDEDAIRERLQGVDVVVNLAGAPIIRRWTRAYKDLLVKSRLDTTRRLVRAMQGTGVRHFISTSAVGIYPDNTPCDEECPGLAGDFLGSLAKRWEEEAKRADCPTTILRFGVILGSHGGALKKMLLPFRLGMGGPIGDGRMMMSWLDVEDLMGIYEFVMEKRVTGVLNAVSPTPVTNGQFTRALARVLKRPAMIPVPAFLLKILFGEGATVLTGSKEVYPRRLLSLGFEFRYPEIEASLRHLLKGA